eukprot:UN09867
MRRKIEKDSPIIKGLAGYISGVCLFLLPKESRKTFALYMLVRAVSDFINYKRKTKNNRRDSPKVEIVGKNVVDVNSSDSSEEMVMEIIEEDVQHYDDVVVT